MSGLQVDAAEGAIYALSMASLLLCVVAAFFTWASLRPHSPDRAGPHQQPAE